MWRFGNTESFFFFLIKERLHSRRDKKAYLVFWIAMYGRERIFFTISSSSSDLSSRSLWIGFSSGQWMSCEKLHSTPRQTNSIWHTIFEWVGPSCHQNPNPLARTGSSSHHYPYYSIEQISNSRRTVFALSCYLPHHADWLGSVIKNRTHKSLTFDDIQTNFWFLDWLRLSTARVTFFWWLVAHCWESRHVRSAVHGMISFSRAKPIS